MDPELKAYLDEWQAMQRSILDNYMIQMDALNRSMDATARCFTAPVKSSSGESELVTASARAAACPEMVSAIGEPLAVPHAAPIDTITLVPACSSTECVTQAITGSTLLPCVSMSPSSPSTSVTNDVVYTELATELILVPAGPAEPLALASSIAASPVGAPMITIDDLSIWMPSASFNRPGCVATPVTVSSGTAKFVLASAEPADPLAVGPSIMASPVVATAAPIINIALVPASCSTECPSGGAPESTSASTLAASPTPSTTTVDLISVLAAAATSNGTFDDEAIEDDASRTTISLRGSPHTSVSMWHVQVLSALVPINCSTTFDDALRLSDQVPVVQTIRSRWSFHTIYRLFSTNWHLEQMHCHTPWPPPFLYLSWCGSSKPLPIPWPSFAELSGGALMTVPRTPFQGTYGEFSVVDDVMYHFPISLSWISPLYIYLPCELDRQENDTSVRRIADREEQFNSVGTSLKVVDHFLKKPCAESEEAPISDLISSGTVVFKLWLIPWLGFIIIGLTSEDEHGFALFPWEIAWQLNGEFFCANTTVQFSILDVKYLLIEPYNCWGVHSHELGAEFLWDPGGCTLALCSSEKKWINHLHCYEQFQQSSVQYAYAFQIWLVARIVHGLEFSTYNGQSPFQGGRNTFRAVFSEQVHDNCNYYLNSINQIIVCDYYLNQAYSFDMVCSDIIYYHKEYHGDSRKTKEVHMPWDPGIVSPLVEASAWGQAEFQGGRDVRTLSCTISLGRWHGLPTSGLAQLIASFRSSPTNIPGSAMETVSSGSRTERRRLLLLPPRL